MAVSIRRAGPPDAARVAELHVEGWQEFRAFVPADVIARRTVATRTDEWAKFLREGPSGTWTNVAELDGAVVGFVSSRLLATPEYGARGEIKNLFVAAGHRGSGVGKALLADAARRLAANGGEPIVLYSFTGNPYRRAYERLGGAVVGERPTEWDGIVVPETAYLWASAADVVGAVYAHAPPGYECPFCAMVRGEDNEPWSTQADVVHRDATTTAWVNGRWWVNNPGAVIVVPNAHVENLYGIDRELAGDIHETARRIALAMRAAFACEGTSTRQHNEPGGMQEVWHYHLHVFPRWVGDDLYRAEARLTTQAERAPYVAALREALAAR
jgi:histidine triad (HIT) family protein